MHEWNPDLDAKSPTRIAAREFAITFRPGPRALTGDVLSISPDVTASPFPM
jgi:hypothetical protein